MSKCSNKRLKDVVFALSGQANYQIWNFNVFLPSGKSLARYVYEKEHDVTLTKVQKIRFSDGNPLNFDTDNLILVDKNDWKKARHIPRLFERQTKGKKVSDYKKCFIQTLVDWGYSAEEIRDEINDWRKFKQDKAEEKDKYTNVEWDKYI